MISNDVRRWLAGRLGSWNSPDMWGTNKGLRQRLTRGIMLGTLPFSPSPQVEEALFIQDHRTALQESQKLKHAFLCLAEETPPPSSRDIFFVEGEPLPCWRHEDNDESDNWLTTGQYYPRYYSMFKAYKEIHRSSRPVRLLEIGVRTGYIAAVFSRAMNGPCAYFGVDPNLYVQNGLELASRTCRQLANLQNGFQYALIKGYSWDPWVIESLLLSSPFDLIHVDGDHSLPGKLHDLDLGRRLCSPEGILLVDDYDHHDSVSSAVRRSIVLGWFEHFAYFPTARGLAVLGGATQNQADRGF